MHRLVLVLTAFLIFGVFLPESALAGQRPRNAKAEEKVPDDGISIEELRVFQGYFYSSGGRDPMIMRFPSDSERGFSETPAGGIKAPTIEEQENALRQWLATIMDFIKQHDYDGAIKEALIAMNKIDNEWPAIKPEHIHLLRMTEDIRNHHRMATRLKTQKETAEEFASLHLKVDGVTWSPTDSRAIVNGVLLSAGEVMMGIRKQGDLRVESIEEHGVVFQFKGMRFRLPVEIFSQLSSTSGPESRK